MHLDTMKFPARSYTLHEGDLEEAFFLFKSGEAEAYKRDRKSEMWVMHLSRNTRKATTPESLRVGWQTPGSERDEEERSKRWQR